MSQSPQDQPLTNLLEAWREGDGKAFGAVIESAHRRLQQMADERMRQFGPMTITAQEVLNEAVARMLESPSQLRNRAHFFATMSLSMRAIVVDHARARTAAKRGGGAVQITISEQIGGSEQDAFDLLAVDEALKQLTEQDPRGGEILHLAYFAGLKQEQIAEVLGISLRTVERELRFLRAWLKEQLSRG